MELRLATARNYEVYVSEAGTVFPSAVRAWAHFNDLGAAASSSASRGACSVVPHHFHPSDLNSSEPEAGPSVAVRDLAASCGYSLSDVPPAVLTMSQLASSAGCPDALRRAARAVVCSSSLTTRPHWQL